MRRTNIEFMVGWLDALRRGELDTVERIYFAAISYGAINERAHMTLAEVANETGAWSNCGEGGENPARGKTKYRSRVRQIASARFGGGKLSSDMLEP